MDPETLSKWIGVLRDLVIVSVAAFMLVFGTTRVTNPALLSIIIGGGLTALGVPAAIRADIFRRRNGNGKPDNPPLQRPAPDPEVTKEDRWSHLP